ncbi:MAG: helix-turn-helix domain-containing protein [Thermoguttaceae bacterium]|nr:helix-turn-helix domain-containing protein [Thermoguttaceae bacterium]
MTRLLNKREAAEYLNISPRTLDYFRERGGLSSHVVDGKLVRFFESELRDWVLGNKAGSGNDNNKQMEEENAKN